MPTDQIPVWTRQMNFSVNAHQRVVDGLNSLLPVNSEEGEELSTPRGRIREPGVDSTGAALIEALPLEYIIPAEDSSHKDKPHKFMRCKLADGQKVVVQVARHHAVYESDTHEWPNRAIMYVTRPTSFTIDHLHITGGVDDDDKNVKPEYVEVCVDSLPILWGKVSEDWTPGTATIKVKPYAEDFETPTGHEDEDAYLEDPRTGGRVASGSAYRLDDFVPYVLVKRWNTSGNEFYEEYFMALGNDDRGLFQVTVAVAEGNGDSTPFKYNVSAGLTSLGTPSMLPECDDKPDVKRVAATLGTGYWVGSDFHLFWVNEKESITECSDTDPDPGGDY